MTDSTTPSAGLPPPAGGGEQAELIEPERRWWRSGWFLVPVLVVVGMLIGLAVITVTARDSSTKLEAAAEACGMSAALGDEGRTLTINTHGDDDATGDDLDAAACVLARTGIPDSIVAQMDATRALDGMQSAAWDGFAGTWTYHPDAGFTLIVTED